MRSRRNGAALSPEMGVFTPPSPFFKNVQCVIETDILLEQQLPQGVLGCDHAGLVINKFSQSWVRGTKLWSGKEPGLSKLASPNRLSQS